MGEPLLSVVLAAVNAGSLAPEIIRNLLGWATHEVEFVLVDDGSTDGTREVFQAAAVRDTRVRVVAFEINEGLGAARRAGFTAARGRYVWNIDVDDQWSENGARLLMDAAQAGTDVVLAAAGRLAMDGTRHVLRPPRASTGREALEALFNGELTGHLWNKVVRRALIEEADFTAARIQSDLIMLVPILARAGTVSVLESEVYCYVETPGSNIRSRRPRGAGLDELARRTDLAAATVGLAGAPSYRRFVAVSLVLSAARDAVIADYPPEESSRRMAAAASRVRLQDVLVLVGRGQLKPAGLLILARFAPRAFRALIVRRAVRRDAMRLPAAG